MQPNEQLRMSSLNKMLHMRPKEAGCPVASCWGWSASGAGSDVTRVQTMLYETAHAAFEKRS